MSNNEQKPSPLQQQMGLLNFRMTDFIKELNATIEFLLKENQSLTAKLIEKEKEKKK